MGGERLRNVRVPWECRTEDKDDESVWAVTCFVVRAGFRKRGIRHVLALAAVDFAGNKELVPSRANRSLGYRRVKVRWVTPLGDETASTS